MTLMGVVGVGVACVLSRLVVVEGGFGGGDGIGAWVFPAGVLGGGTPFWWGWAASAGDLKDAIVYLSALKASFVYLR
ncbi:hypothetical protein D5S17_15990 [Pseudonocardiaceae bacterium YIM PH 21723]|nr:hypothetical protein D5S17_15990 [Pseudonocardiaceae bacterium YIM PH 21723]